MRRSIVLALAATAGLTLAVVAFVQTRPAKPAATSGAVVTSPALVRSASLVPFVSLVDYLPRVESLRYQRDSEALLLLVPEAGGRGKGVLSGKVFEYIAAGRPILALVPPDGAAADCEHIGMSVDAVLVNRPVDGRHLSGIVLDRLATGNDQRRRHKADGRSERFEVCGDRRR